MLMILSLVSCAQMVVKKINHHNERPAAAFQNAEKVLQPHRYRHCIESELCMSYWHIAPSDKPSTLNMNIKAYSSRYTADSKLTLSNDDQNLFQGTMVILPCYTCTKESMSFHAMYFQHLGFDVLIPDLLGHGESSRGLGFGVKDAHLLEHVLKSHPELPQPLLLTALSMGAYTAAHLQNLIAVDGMIWIAPSIQFDDAVAVFPQLSGSGWHQLVPEASLRQGALQALAEANVELHQTNIQHFQPHMPSLIIASDIDPVAPYQHYAHWQQQAHIDVINLAGRPHPLMLLIGTEEHEIIFNWLDSFDGATEENSQESLNEITP